MVYISQEAFLDKMYVLQKRLSTIIYSHETALFLHDLTDSDPIYYTVTLPSNVRVFYIKRELYDVGVTTMQTVFGNNVLAYGLERTICDCIRSRNKMDIAIVTDAMKRYVKRPDKDLNLLMSFADQFSISNVIKSYLEAFL